MKRTYRIAQIDGDGIGPEVTRAARSVLEAVERQYGLFRLEFEKLEAGAELYRRTGVALPDEVFESCASADAILLGAVGLPDVRLADGTEVQGEVMFRLRFDLDLYAGERPIRHFHGSPSPLLPEIARDIDYVIVRENVEGLYASRGGGCVVRNHVATDTVVITREGTEKVCRYAFELALRRQRPDRPPRVTCVDKSNVLRSYAFFRQVFEDVAKAYPDVRADFAYVDAMSLWLVQRPGEYDVLVTENMFGDILSDLGAATVGGMGLAPSADVGERHGLFQPSHGTAPDIAGKGVANPLATILSGAMMLEWLGQKHGDGSLVEAGDAVSKSVARVIRKGTVTPDLGGTAKTEMVVEAVIAAVEEGSFSSATPPGDGGVQGVV